MTINERPLYYILDGDAVHPATDDLDKELVYEQFRNHKLRRIGSTYLNQKGEILSDDNENLELPEDSYIWVSTVFLVIDHDYTGTGEPVLFETMVFGPAKVFDREHMGDVAMQRYHTAAEAREGHGLMVLKVRDWLAKHGSLEGLESEDVE